MAKSVLSAEHFHDKGLPLWLSSMRGLGRMVRLARAVESGTGLVAGTAKGICKCYACRKPFTATVGLMESSHIPLHVWLQAMHLLLRQQKGDQHPATSPDPWCTLKSACFLSHRIREAMKTPDVAPMVGLAGPSIYASASTGAKPTCTDTGRIRFPLHQPIRLGVDDIARTGLAVTAASAYLSNNSWNKGCTSDLLNHAETMFGGGDRSYLALVNWNGFCRRDSAPMAIFRIPFNQPYDYDAFRKAMGSHIPRTY